MSFVTVIFRIVFFYIVFTLIVKFVLILLRIFFSTRKNQQHPNADKHNKSTHRPSNKNIIDAEYEDLDS